MNKNLLSMNKLKKDIHDMRLFSLLLPKENREQFKRSKHTGK